MNKQLKPSPTDFRIRRLEQRRHQFLETISRVIATIAAIFLSTMILAPVAVGPFTKTISFFVLSVVVAGRIERLIRRGLGYEARKASLYYPFRRSPVTLSRPEEIA
jgi:hypothetical protein